MVKDLLLRGMLVGVFAGLLVFAFGKVGGEPFVDRAITFETAMDSAKAAAAAARGEPVEVEPEIVSRAVQASFGLLTGAVVFCTAMGGLFALVFAAVEWRLIHVGPRIGSAILAATGFTSVFLVPFLQYPANPPAIGQPDTIGHRTALYFGMIGLSIAAVIGAVLLRRRLVPRVGAWSATTCAAAAYGVAMLIAGAVLPRVSEVPADFPATVLWQFRIASIGMQALLWATLGIGFGFAAEGVARAHGMDVEPVWSPAR